MSIAMESPVAYWDVSDAEYYADTSAASQSMLKVFLASPARYHAMFVTKTLPKPDPTQDMILGSLTGARILTPAEWTRQFACAPECDRRTKAGKEAWATFVEESHGKTVVSEEQLAISGAMVSAAMSHPVSRALLMAPGMVERPLRWTDSDSGLACKAKLDKLILPGDRWSYPIIVEAKTSAASDPDGFSRQLFNLGYHVQDAMYTEAATLMLGAIPLFLFLVIGKEPPHDVWVHRLDNQFKTLGRDTLADARRRLAAAHKEDRWLAPGQETLTTLAPERWMLK